MPSFDRATFDDSRWPLLRVRLPGTLPPQGHEECLAGLSDYLRRGERFLLLIDLSRVGLVPIEQRWRQVEWFEEYETLLREQLVGVASIIVSPVVRLSVTAILFFKPFPVPHMTFPSLAAAEAWAAERLQEAGLTQAGKGR
ncbi:hypothetical protein [Vitiosangium sp. GDMCC 1.1324]|uniref:hypothetical protein n=1 Tax=Vitiosangium sp. (strain GDMCC 1.1324) TaxID=2138576 RepID=UPI000D3B6FE2|nr:hypothetical protein [Vitiosangium sp. GDMCC 1.1324]PTL82293.1 hypothetical protein DAT35_21135 [Vitiosangium sp. GDMCC 1.1324]